MNAVEKATANFGPNTLKNANDVVVSGRAISPVTETGARVCFELHQSYKYRYAKATKRNKSRNDWDVPIGFDFPTADLHVAWTAWLLGYHLNKSQKGSGEVYAAPVKPLRLLRNGNLPVAASGEEKD